MVCNSDKWGLQAPAMRFDDEKLPLTACTRSVALTAAKYQARDAESMSCALRPLQA